MKAKDMARRAVPFVVSVAIVAGGFAWNAHETFRREAELSVQRDQIAVLQQQLEEIRNGVKDEQNAATEKASGVSHAREVSDRNLAEDFLEDCASWKDFASYCECRERAVKDYGLPEDGQFLTSYMAPIAETTFLDGTTYNYIDAEGLNSRMYGIDDYLVSAKDDVYRHFAFVTFRTEDNGRSAEHQAIMSYAVDGNGKIFDVEVENI